MKTLSILACLMLAVPAVAVVPAAQAQTSFSGKSAEPTNRAEWEEAVNEAIMKSIRSANSSLAVAGSPRRIEADVQVTISRNGQVTDVKLTKSGGSPSIDQAILRAVSRTKQVPAFTPDMTGQGILFTLALRSGRS